MAAHEGTTADTFDEETPILPRRRKQQLGASNKQVSFSTALRLEDDDGYDDEKSAPTTSPSTCSILCTFLSSIPATILVTVLNLMLAVPFGSAYFSPIIPLDETTRETLGIRLSLMALTVGQFVMGGGLGSLGSSAFDPIIVWQLGELSPFYHTLAEIAAAVSESDDEIFPTTLYLLSLSTACVGGLFFVLGKFGLGQLVYFFPTHVLLGLVGGIGVWLAVLATSVSISPSRAPSGPEFYCIWTVQFLISFLFAIGLRILRCFFPKERFMLLDPIFFLSIPVIFYLVLLITGISVDEAIDAGYFFADPDAAENGPDDSIPAWIEAGQLWTNFDFSKVIWSAAWNAGPTLLSAGVMGVMISSPFIPATATLYPSMEFDFNREFISHGWSNGLSSIICPGGLGVAVCYSTTSVYKNAGGKGKLANVLASILMFGTMIWGPRLVTFIPRCMAGAILFDLGISLILEAVVDPYHQCDKLEYTSIWIIVLVLNLFNMTAALIAGLLAAVFTYALQSSINKDPVRLVCDAVGFPSSKWRNISSRNILDEATKGRSRIAVIQLQGQIFFGNVAKVQDRIFDFLEERKSQGRGVYRLLLDFTLVQGIDTTASTYFEKMIERIQKKQDAVTYMVSGPLDIQDSSLQRKQSSAQSRRKSSMIFSQTPPSQAFSGSSRRAPSDDRRISCSVRGHYETLEREAVIHGVFFENLDEALIKSEDDLIAKCGDLVSLVGLPPFDVKETDEERDEIIKLLSDKFEKATENIIGDLVDACKREVIGRGENIWMMGDEPSSAKILLGGTLQALITDEEDGKRQRKSIEIGDIVGLRCMVLNERHRATLRCETECVFYALSAETYSDLVQANLRVVHMVDLYLARDLSRRLHHASNAVYLSSRSVLE